MLGHAHNKRQRLKGSGCSENGSMVALGAFLKHEKFHLRREIEPSPSVRLIHCLNSSLFSSDAKRAGTSCRKDKTKKFHGITSVPLQRLRTCFNLQRHRSSNKKKKYCSYSTHTFPHLYQKSEPLEVKCGGNV